MNLDMIEAVGKMIVDGDLEQNKQATILIGVHRHEIDWTEVARVVGICVQLAFDDIGTLGHVRERTGRLSAAFYRAMNIMMRQGDDVEYMNFLHFCRFLPLRQKLDQILVP